MVSMFDRRSFETITVWSLAGFNEHNEPNLATPSTFLSRWEEKTEEVMTPSQESFLSKAVVFIPNGVDVNVGDWLALGDMTAAATPDLGSGQEVKAVVSIPSLRSNRNETRAYM